MNEAEIVLIHAGIGDNRMWDPIEPLLTPTFTVRRHELPGFGGTEPPPGSFSYADHLAASLVEPTVLIGASFGGQIALELAAAHPELVTALVLLDPALPDHVWSDEVLAYLTAEERLVEAGEVQAAVELNVAFWVGDAEPEVRELVRTMVARGLELQLASEGEGTGSEVIELGAVTAPVLVVVGDQDRQDFHRIGERLTAELPNGRSAQIAGAGHLPALERPDATAAMIIEFVGSHAPAPGSASDSQRTERIAMSEETTQAEPAGEPTAGRPRAPGGGDTNDLGGADGEGDAYERAQPDSQPKTSSEPEPDAEPADAG